MKTRLGIDIVHISKFKKLMENRDFIKKVFHISEVRNYRPEHLAGIFATKEAFFKAINKNPNPNWLEVEVKNKKTGLPVLAISNELKKKAKIKEAGISISHDKDYAIAAVICYLSG